MSILQELMDRIPELAVCESDVQAAFECMKECFEKQGKMLLCGNGGSAADAEHWSGELLKSFVKKRPPTDEERARMGNELASHLERGLPAIPLTSFVSLGTAFANDRSPQMIFAQLTYALGKTGDVLVGISTSGNAENVCHALKVARSQGLRTVGLTGQDGGAMKALCDVCIRVPLSETYRIQELHLPVYHTLCIMLEDAFF